MKPNSWYKKVLLRNIREIVSDGMTYVILALVLLLWHYSLGVKLKWHSIAPLSEPSIFIRTFYSAFTFCTLGFLLYVLRFYKALHKIVVRAFGMWKLYILIKALVWLLLMYISYAYIVPWLFNFLNMGTSLLFNISNLVLYVSPPLGISLILSVIYLFLKGKLHAKERNIKKAANRNK